MRIGILTFQRSYNYGAFMQCYSLSKRIQRDFPSAKVEVIDYLAPGAMGAMNKLVQNSNPAVRTLLEERNSAISASVNALPLSKTAYHYMDCDDFLKAIDSEYDLLIVGSDAVFNWNGKGLPNAFFLFNRNSKVPRASYAASVYGMDYTQISDEQAAYFNGALSAFAYLGVRDTATEGLPAYVRADAKPIHNCDPTCLLDMNDLPVDMNALRTKLTKKGIDISRPIIGIMASDHIGREIRRHFGTRVQYVSLYTPNKYADVFLSDLTPFEWARVFGFFSVTVTHYFHGTYLSLKNGTPVIDVEVAKPYMDQYDTKILDLLKRTGLTEFYHLWKRDEWSRLKRAMYKWGAYRDNQFWNGVNEHIEQYLVDPPRQKISDSLDRESRFYDSFHTFLNGVINNAN